MSASLQETDPSISNFVSIFKAASERYKKLTKQDLDAHPFAEELGKCDSPAAVLDLFQTQAQAFEEFRKGDERLMKWLDPTVNIITKFSATVAAGNAPANLVFTGITILLVVGFFQVAANVSLDTRLFQTARDVVASHETLVTLFESIQLFLRRLNIYTGIQLPIEMIELLSKIMGQVLFILALSTREMNPQPEPHWQGRFSKKLSLVYCLGPRSHQETENFFKTLIGRKDVENALQELDRFTKEETQLVTAKNFELAQSVKEGAHRLFHCPQSPC
jgi:fungal STAND N-terminal Goodbye domain